jgi:hypothetical protein
LQTWAATWAPRRRETRLAWVILEEEVTWAHWDVVMVGGRLRSDVYGWDVAMVGGQRNGVVV